MDMIVDEKRGKKKENLLDVLARQGALKMLTEALDREVTDFLEAPALQAGQSGRPKDTAMGNGYGR